MPKRISPPVLEIRQKKGANGWMTGRDTELLIDGVPVRGATAVNFSVEAGGLARATIEVLGTFIVSGRVKPVKKVKKIAKLKKRKSS